MIMANLYYINYIHPETGFLEREEFLSHREQMKRVDELRRKGVKHITYDHYRVESSP